MKYFLIVLFSVLFGVGASAQRAENRNTAFTQTAVEQRRVDLRMALREQRGREAPERAQAVEEKPANRHLSMQERENLRQQLRLQRQDGRTE